MFCKFAHNWRFGEVVRTSPSRHHIGTFMPLGAFHQKYKSIQQLVFQTQIWSNKIENNRTEIHLYSSKLTCWGWLKDVHLRKTSRDVLGTSVGYFSKTIWIQNNKFWITSYVLWHHVSPCRRHFRTLLGRFWYISSKFMRKCRNSIFFSQKYAGTTR